MSLENFILRGSPKDEPQQMLQSVGRDLAKSPNNQNLKLLLGYWHKEQGNYQSADDLFRETIADTKSPTAKILFALNLLERNASFSPLAKATLERITPQTIEVEALQNLGIGLTALASHRYPEARFSFLECLSQDAQCVEAVVGLSKALWFMNLKGEAISYSQRGWSLDKENHHVNMLKAWIAYKSGELEQAEQFYCRAAKLRPWKWDAQSALGSLLLSRKQLDKGWQHYDKWPEKMPSLRRYSNLPKCRWQGENLQDKSLLLISEQGNGDAILFIRYLNEILKTKKHVSLFCDSSLKSLFSRISDSVEIIESPSLFDNHDTWAPLQSLPKLFDPNLTKKVACTPYLSADRDNVASWKNQLSGPAKVGLAWAGNSNQSDDHWRSIDLTLLAPLLQDERFQFYSIQTGPRAQDIVNLGLDTKITDLSPSIRNYHDTAAIIEALDLVITVDTSVAHLAGALGKQVWVMIPRVCYWIWFRDVELSVWYPTMKLYRQSRMDDWSSVVDRVNNDLTKWHQNFIHNEAHH